MTDIITFVLLSNALAYCAHTWNLLRPSRSAVANLFPGAVFFSETTGKFMSFLSNLCTFCIISCSIGVNLGTNFENLSTDSVIFLLCSIYSYGSKGKVWKKVFFIGLIPIQTIYAILSQISKCREIRVFQRNSFASKTAVAGFFLTNFMYDRAALKSAALLSPNKCSQLLSQFFSHSLSDHFWNMWRI